MERTKVTCRQQPIGRDKERKERKEDREREIEEGTTATAILLADHGRSAVALIADVRIPRSIL